MKKIILSYPVNTIPVSITGNKCRLDCKHCGGFYLNSMKDWSEITPGDVGRMLIVKKNTNKSILVSGGCDIHGAVPLWEKIELLNALKEAGFRLNLHTGLIPPEKIPLIAPLANIISFDFITDDMTIREVYGSRRPEVGSRRSEVGGQKLDVGCRMSDVGGERQEVGSRFPRPLSHFPNRRDVPIPITEVGRWRMENGMRRMDAPPQSPPQAGGKLTHSETISHFPHRSGSDYIETYIALSKEANVVPHITIGILGGKIRGEYDAIDTIASLGCNRIVFLVFIPTMGSYYEKCSSPSMEDVESVFSHARKVLPGGSFGIGCMHPRGKYKYKLERLAYEYGFDSYVNPSKKFRSFLNKLKDEKKENEEIEMIINKECCAFS